MLGAISLVSPALLLGGGVTRHVPMVRMESAAEIGALPLKQLKAELDALGVQWRGVCFEKAELVDTLIEARTRAEAEAAEPSPKAAEPEEESNGGGVVAEDAADSEEFSAAYAEAYARAMALKVGEIRAELAARRTSWAGIYLNTISPQACPLASSFCPHAV